MNIKLHLATLTTENYMNERKKFVAPSLIEETSLTALTLGVNPQISGNPSTAG